MTVGRHYGGFKYRNKRDQSHRRRTSVIGTVITAIAGIVVNDLSSENSKIKKLFDKVIQPKQIEEKEKGKKIINVEYSIINNENEEIKLNGEKK